MLYKIALIIPYFGKWPEWIDLYLYSCSKNQFVDFIFYTDCTIPNSTYQNIIFHKYSFEEYKALVSENINCIYNVDSPYKLTDLKPFLGAVHHNELSEYDFWGFGDLDVVYGDLSMLLNDNMLDKYDFITTHSYRVAGHFTVVRNNEYYRNLCFKIDNWKEKLTENKHYGLDEMDWSRLINPYETNIGRLYRYILKPFGIPQYKAFDLFDKLLLRRKHLKEYFTTELPVAEDGTIRHWQYDVRKGCVIDYRGRSIPYLHFLCFKKNIWIKSDTYWRDGYYQLDKRIDNYSVINFDYQSIKGEE